MVNDILYALTSTLKANFKNVTIYADKVEQGLIEPCFFVLPLEASEDKLLNVRAYRNVSFDIQYLDEKRLSLEKIASELYPLLRQVKMLDGSIINGMNLKHEIVDNVLHFFVDFKIVIKYQSETVEKQNDININVGVK